MIMENAQFLFLDVFVCLCALVDGCWVGVLGLKVEAVMCIPTPKKT